MNRIKSFDLTDFGPFKVYVESIDQNIGSIHPMSLGRIIYSHDKSVGENVISIGRNRICVEMRTASSANKFINSEIWKSKKLEIYIPQFLSRRVGVIRKVAVEISEKDIAENLRVEKV